MGAERGTEKSKLKQQQRHNSVLILYFLSWMKGVDRDHWTCDYNEKQSKWRSPVYMWIKEIKCLGIWKVCVQTEGKTAKREVPKSPGAASEHNGALVRHINARRDYYFTYMWQPMWLYVKSWWVTEWRRMDEPIKITLFKGREVESWSVQGCAQGHTASESTGQGTEPESLSCKFEAISTAPLGFALTLYSYPC